MLFNSLTFLFFFLPILVLLYWIVPKSFRNYILIVFSLVFYFWGGASYSIVLIASISINHGFAHMLSKSGIKRKSWLVSGLVFNIGLLFAFKYLGFFFESLNQLTSNMADVAWLPDLSIVLPLGISFYTFQSISMLVDIYRNPGEFKSSYSNTLLYVGFFPQLVAGPIIRYQDIISQINARKDSLEDIEIGLKRFIRGLVKKVIFANTFAVIADKIFDFNISGYGSGVALLGIVVYSLQIYFDFSGYSDMAIGLGRMFGFKIPENFNYPYISRSIQEFWRRWHISLSVWFRDYLYIPLGGNRVSSGRVYLNLIIVFLLTGFWHGASWNFIFWGLYHGLFLLIERLFLKDQLTKIPSSFSWLYMAIVVMIGWVFFRSDTLEDGFNYIQALWSLNPNGIHVLTFLDNYRVLIIALGILLATPIKNWIQSQLTNKYSQVLSWPIYVLAFIYCVLLINSGSYSPFIYFRF